MNLKRTWTPALVVAFIALVTGGWLLQASGNGQSGAFFKAQLFEQVHQLVSERYVDETDPSELYQMAIDGMLRELGDPYSSYLDADQMEQLQLSTTGNYGGLGIRIDSRNDWITVVSVLPNTPAERQGLQTGDRIIAVEEESAEGWSTEEAVNELRGPRGSEVGITVARVGSEAPLQFTIERDEIHVEAVHAFMAEPGVGYVRLNPFSREARNEVESAIDDLRDQGAESLILDLRQNPGGLLDEGVAVSDLFLEEGDEVVSTRSRVPSENDTYRASSPDQYPGLPVVVLVDGYSASASEIVAGALQDHDRALIIGTGTFGKGSVQSLFNLPEDNYLKLTTGKWYTPAGRSIDKPRDQVANLASRAVSMGGEPVGTPTDTAALEKYRTESGRVVYGGGGITPDLIVMPDTLTTDQQIFRTRLSQKGVALQNASFRFAVSWLESNGDIEPDFEVTPEMRGEFYDYLVEKAGESLDLEMYESSSELVDWHLSQEIANAAFGETARWQRRLAIDQQVDTSLALLTRAGTPDELFALARARVADSEGAGPETTAAGSAGSN